MLQRPLERFTMAIVAGIDEAGLGPILGPLVVTGAVFRVPDDQIDLCLWKTLRESCTNKTSRNEHRLPVADSKKLYKPRTGIAGLERTALVMLAARREAPVSFRGLLDQIAPQIAESLARYPWYAKSDPPLPVDDRVGDIALRANAVRKNCSEQNVRFLQTLSEPLLAGEYNDLVARTDNKSTVLLGQALRIIHRIVSGAKGEALRIYVDRLGGRMRYRPSLMLALPEWEMAVLGESQDRSAYELTKASATCRIEFVTKGDRLHFPVALASIFSKYLRELLMREFNAYFSTRMEELAPTAGYYTDAHRWLGQAAGLLEKLGVDRRILVRER